MTTRREPALDGLRGWAALVVCSYHFFWELFAVRFPQFHNIVTATLCNGRLAVSLFFVLTGYVLTVGQWGSSNKHPTYRQIAKRHLRLSIPIVFASAVTLIVIGAGWASHLSEAAHLVGREDWLGNWLHFEPSPAGAAMFSVFTVYWPIPIEFSYNAFLWTMPYELAGSYLVLIVCAAERPLLSPVALLALLSGILLAAGDFWALGACFSLGATLAILRQQGFFSSSGSWWPVLVAFAAAVTAGYVQLVSGPVWMVAVLATVIVTATLSSDRIGRLLSLRLSQSLGRLSYPIYLMQFPVIIGLSSTLIVGAGQGGFLNETTAIAIYVVSLTATIVAALPFVWVERLTAGAGQLLTTLIWPTQARATASR